MPAFIDYVIQCISDEDKNPVKDAMQLTIKRIGKIDSPKSEGGQSYGALCRIFDKAPLTVEKQRFLELQKKYLELMTLAALQMPKGKKNHQLSVRSEEFTRELLKDCSQEILNADGQLEETLTAVLKLDSVDIDSKLKSKALIYSFVHHLLAGISESVRGIIFAEAAAKNNIKITDNNNPLKDIMAGSSLLEGSPGRKSSDAAWKDIEKFTNRQRIIDSEIPVLLNQLQDQYENIQSYLNTQSHNITVFLQNYIHAGFSTKVNTDFIKILHDPVIMKTITPRLSIFKLDRDVIGEVLLQYLAEHYPQETKDAAKRIAFTSRGMSSNERKRLEHVAKSIPDEPKIEVSSNTAPKQLP
jgi:hypothetical protein